MAKFMLNGDKVAKKDMGKLLREERKVANALLEEWKIACKFNPKDVEAFRELRAGVTATGKAVYIFDKKQENALERFKCFKAMAQTLDDKYTVNLYRNAQNQAVFEIRITKDAWDLLFENAE